MPAKTIYHRMKALNARMAANYRRGIGPIRVVLLLCTASCLAACTSPIPAATAVLVTATSTQPIAATFTPLPPTIKASPTATSTSTHLPTSVFVPVIRDEPGGLYETVFTLPVGGDSLIQYMDSGCCINGPNALAALPDGSFLISDMVYDRRLLHYSPTGELIAVRNDGEVFVLLPRADTISIIRLVFYRQFEPFMPGAVPPEITSSVQP